MAGYSARASVDRVGPAWLVTVRWTLALAAIGAVVAGRSVLDAPVPLAPAIALIAAQIASNLWLARALATTPTIPSAATRPRVTDVAGLLLCGDVVLLSWLLFESGGVLNPANIFYLVPIVVAALVLGRRWTWAVTALSAGGYAALFLARNEALGAAQTMHPEIALHMRGMWLAFALTSLIVAVLVSRLAIAVERRDHALEDLRARTDHAMRAAGLATLAAGAAHELSTPLATIAVAARELEHRARNADASLQEDARLIRAETDRCRRILDAMAGQSGDVAGESPSAGSLQDVVTALAARLRPDEHARLDVRVPEATRVVWPIHVVAGALRNLVQNALQASPAGARVQLDGAAESSGDVRLTVTDGGRGIAAEHLARVGEPFFTTKPTGEGTGLGVFVARSSIEQLGGRFSLASSPDRGTVATIVLPADVVAATVRAHA